MLEQTEHLSLDDFVHEYGRAPFELIHGERIPKMPPVMPELSIPVAKLFES